MKKQILTLVAACLIGGTALAAAKNPKKVEVTVVDGRTVEVLYKTTDLHRVKVEIFNAEKKVVFSEEITSGSFMRPYNLSSLKEGVYYVKVTDENTFTEEKVIIGKIPQISIPEEFQHARIFRMEGENKFAVTCVSGKKDVFNITVTNEKGQVIYNENELVDSFHGNILNTEKFKAKSFQIEVKNSKGDILKSVTF